MLLSIGFDATIIKTDNINENLFDFVKNTELINSINISVTTNMNAINDLNIFSLLSPNSDFDLVLVMTEPSIETNNNNGAIEGKTDWITWFDNLSKYKEIVEHEI